MRNKIKFISALFIFSLLLTFYFVLTSRPKEHKVLDIIRADLFYVDINNNSKIDSDELFKLDGVYSFDNELNDFAINYSDKLHISKLDYLKAGFLAKNWAVDNLKGSDIVITSVSYDKSKNYKYISANYKGEDLAKFYIDSGLAFSGNLIYQNENKVKANVSEMSKIPFVLLNLNTDVYHKLDCEFVELLHKAKLIPLKFAKNHIPCKSCTKSAPLNTPSFKITSLNKKFNNIELYLISPLIYNKPDNSCSSDACKKLLSEINGSKTSIDIAVYGFGDIDKINVALNNARKRGVKVRAVADYSTKMDEIYPKTRQFISDFSAITDKNDVIMHNKFFIFDDKKVLTGSANISSSGIGGYSSNIVIVVNSPIIANRYKAEFEQMYDTKFSVSKDKLDLVSDKNITAYFSPKDNLKELIIDKINSSSDEICVSAFYLTNKEIINALISARTRGVRVYIILDATGANNFKDRVRLLRNSNVALIVENWGGKEHEKTMVFDKESIIIGSANFSNAAFYKNDENLLLIENSEVAKFYREYFFTLFNSIDKKYLHYIPRAEGKESKNSCTDGIDNNFDGKIDNEDEGCK